MGDSGYETLLFERDGEDDRVAWLTLNRPNAHNAFDATMRLELRDAWLRLRRDETVRAVVLTGAGETAFCTGIDRYETIGDGDDAAAPVGYVDGPVQFDDPGDMICPKQCDMWKPVVAAVNGIACGGAFYLLGESDIVVAAEHATFFDPHVTYGMPAVYEPIHLIHKLPLGELLRMSLLGAAERMSAQRAHEIGLVSEVVPADQLRDHAGWCARAIAASPPHAVQTTLRAVWSAHELARRQALATGPAWVGVGMDDASLRQGQERFASGERIEWRTR